MEKEQRTNNQVEGIIFRKGKGGKTLFLMMKRIESRGGFWQPLTGGVRVGEELESALLREIAEETGIIDIKRVVNTDYTYEFGEGENKCNEYVFGVEVPESTTVILSHEHDEYQWVSKEEAQALLKWPGNIEGLNQLCAILETE